MDYRSSSSDDVKWTIDKGGFWMKYKEFFELWIRILIVLALTAGICIYFLSPGVTS